MTLVHHDQAVAKADRVVHVVGHHERGELTLADDLLRELEDLRSRLGVQRGGVLVEQQHARVGERCHEQGERLALTAGQQADLCLHARLQAKVEALEQLDVLGALVLGDAPAQAAALPAALGKGEVLLDLHVRGGAAHGILEHAAQVLGALGLGQARDVLAVQLDSARIERIHARDHIEQGGLASAVAADDSHEIAVGQGEINAGEGALLGDGAAVERLLHVGQLKHLPHRPSNSSHAA